MAKLILSDGTSFEGQPFGFPCEADGEVVFNTGMAGYVESLTDPSYRGQILVFTYPLIGNYGVPSAELNEYGFSKNFESEVIHVRGVIVAQESRDFSHFNAVSSLHNWLEHHKIPGITGVDTRALTKKLREHGVMLGRIAGGDTKFKIQNSEFKIDDPNLTNLVAEVSCKEVITYEPIVGNDKSEIPACPAGRRNPKSETAKQRNSETAKQRNSETAKQRNTKSVAVFDCGIKNNILRSFLKRGVAVHRLPWNFDLDASGLEYDAVFISNGPGDPKMCKETIVQISKAIEKGIPTFGICLGNQLMALAVGGDTYKLKYGHRGVNQPCIEQSDCIGKYSPSEPDPITQPSSSAYLTPCPPLLSGEGDKGGEVNVVKGLENTGDLSGGNSAAKGSKCIITSQNHGFAVDEKSLSKDWSVWFTNANDGTVEGIRHKSGKFFSVQFHPEATPGPEDADYLFDEFVEAIGKTPVTTID